MTDSEIDFDLVQEIVYMNDEYNDSKWDEATRRLVHISPEERWSRMRAWVASQVKTPYGFISGENYGTWKWKPQQ
jgi:hypothetical protein